MEENYNYRPVVLVILDGWGEWSTKMGNPVTCAKLPTINELDAYYPKLLIEASGLAVGLPWGVPGNSEVGHQTLGSGQIIYHHLPTITGAIQSRSLFSNQVLINAFTNAKKNKKNVHFMGLVSDGGVHSHIDHLFALLKMAKEQSVADVYVHAITDGRDTPPRSAVKYLESVSKYLKEIGIGQIATVSGRYYIMDRNRNWDRVENGFLAMTKGEGFLAADPIQALEQQYAKKVFDEFIDPIVITSERKKPLGLIEDGDTVINFNFRADRARQITRAFVLADFDKFKTASRPNNIYYVGLSEYEESVPIKIAFPSQKITTRVGGILSENKKKQLRIAETEKFAHVTYFFNGGLAEPFAGEDRIFVPSKNVKSYAEIPEMSAYEVTEKLLKAISTDKYDFVLVNYANTDMIGHTGVFKAGIKTLEVIDACLERLISTVLAVGGCLIITADHGNIEEMMNLETGEVDTKHSTNPVPLWFVAPDNKKKQPQLVPLSGIKGMLVDVPAMVLELFNIKTPTDMIGESLLARWD